VEPVVDDDSGIEESLRDRALQLYRGLGQIVDAEIDEPSPDSRHLSFELAARVDFGAHRKQDLLELRSEPERLRMLTSLLERASEAITLERAVAEAASRNGHGLRRE
jgi:Lon protease-like protein